MAVPFFFFLVSVQIVCLHLINLASAIANIAFRTGRMPKCDPSNGHILNDNEAINLWSREYEKGRAPKA